jgi:hypothetical protein
LKSPSLQTGAEISGVVEFGIFRSIFTILATLNQPASINLPE